MAWTFDIGGGPGNKKNLVSDCPGGGGCTVTLSGPLTITAGGDYKPTPTQCLLNVGPASTVLVSIHSALVSTSCCRSVCTFRVAHYCRQRNGSICLFHKIFGKAMTGKRERSDASEKEVYT